MAKRAKNRDEKKLRDKKKDRKAEQDRGKGEDQIEASLSEIHRPLSLVAQVERTLRSAIENNFFPNGRLPTLLELAVQLRVSRETVRLSLESLQKEGLIVKRRRRGTFVRRPEVPAELSRPRPMVLGYLLEEFDAVGNTEETVTRPSSGPMLEGAILEASRRGYQLNMRSAKPFQLRETFNQMETSSPMCGVIFACVVEEKFLKGLSGRGIPAILLDHELHLSNVGSLRGDSEQNASLAVKQLAEIGHQRIACAHWQQSDLNPWFIPGYRKGMRDANLRCRRNWEMFIELSPTGAKEAVDHLLTLSPRPTAIICFHNTFANQFVAAALERGLRVPDDISVVGCGGEEVVNLSCTQLDWPALGRTAVQMLLRAVDEDKADQPEHLLVPYEWRKGGTVVPVGPDKSLPLSEKPPLSEKKGTKNKRVRKAVVVKKGSG